MTITSEQAMNITPDATLHIEGGGTLAVWREQVSYVRGRGRDGSTVIVEGLEFDVTEDIGQVFRLLNP